MGLKQLPWDSYIGRGDIGGDTSHNALKWVPSMYNSFDHFPYIKIATLYELTKVKGKGSVTHDLGANISLPHCLATGS